MKRVLRCADCGLPWATIQNGCIVVQSLHSGRKHFNAISITELLTMLAAEEIPAAVKSDVHLASA